MNALMLFPWFLGVNRTADYDDSVITQRCGDHVHLSFEQEERVLEALGVSDFCDSSWRKFIKRELSLKGEYSMMYSVYVRRLDGNLHRFGVVRSEVSRGFSQAETSPGGHLALTGKIHNHERMSGNLEGTEVIDIVAVRLNHGLIIFLPEPISINVLVPAAHVHVPFSFHGGNEMAVRYGNIEIALPTKVSECNQSIVHLHAERYAEYMLAVEEYEKERSADAPFALASGSWW